MKIHLGCGKRYIPGFTHVDLASFPHIDYETSVDDLSVFADNSAELIYACQVLEYFDREEIPGVLAEWKRVLKPSGILRLSVPNFATLANLYKAGLSLDFFLGTLYGKWPINGGNHIYHKTTFDNASLTKVLSDAGFTDPTLWDWRSTEHAEVDDYSQAYFPHMDKARGILWNLNMECKKPGFPSV